MKEIIRMNQLAGVITEGQARKMLEILNEENEFSDILTQEDTSSILTQEDFDTLESKGFEIKFTIPKWNLFWIERKYGLPKADWKYLNNLLQKKNIPFDIKFWRGDGDKGQSKEIWIDTKYTNVPNPKSN
jgi:hypothetical protein